MPKRHTIAAGESLPKLAELYYGDARRWPAIERASTFKSGRGQLVYPGETAIIPDLGTEPPTDFDLSKDVSEDEISVIVAGRVFSGWQGLNLQENEDTFADGFSITAPFNPDDSDMREAFRPFSYRLCQVYIGKDRVLKGTIEQISPSGSASDRTITIGGRSVSGAMVDSSIEGQGQEFKGQSLRTICQWIAGLFGVEVVDDTEDTGPIPETRPEPTQTAFEFLNDLAKSKGRLLTTDSRGILRITKPSSAGNPVAAIVEGEGLFVEASANYDGAKRHSRYIVYLDSDGTPGIRGAAEDEGIPIYRPHQEEPNAAATDANTAAAWARTIALSEATAVNVTVSRWRRENGEIWRKGDFVTLRSPSAMVYQESLFRVAGRSFEIDDTQGKQTVLRLVLPQAFTTQMPERHPWDEA